jgi:uncharacterized damage-inducible protein DinB
MNHMDRSALLVLHNYNCHANDLVLVTAAKLDEAAFTASSSPSHGSVQHLLMHILAVEASFLAKCKGEQPNQKVFQVETMTLAELAAEFAQVRNLRLEYLMNTSAEALAEAIPVTIGGHPLSLARWQMLAQSLISSAHHRGELSIVMTGLGQPLPTLDIILQFVAESGQRWLFD